MQPLYGSHPHTPRTSTPNTPTSASNLPSYQNTSQPAPRPAVYSMAQNPYPPNQGYGTSAPMMPQTTTAASHAQPIAPAPAGGRGPPVLRPMPPGGIMAQPGVSSPYGPGSMMQPNNVLHEGDQPTHVVGSQGRRGILPSAPGRPAAPTAGTGAKNNIIPVKDADGKFPCPHCTKTYLHAKHLKRHLLRHTGDRPYMCVLCRDTFSRSDILKRHFQKCSIRRGNPTGASHLSHPQAHVKKNTQAQKAAGLGNEGDMQHLNGMNNMPADGMVHPFGIVPVNDGMSNMPGDQNQLSRSNSHGGHPQDRNNMAPSMGAPQPYGANVSNSMNNQQMPSYSMPPGQNGMPMYGGSNGNQQSGLDWSQMFQSGAHQPLNSNLFHPPNRGQTQIATKTGPNHDSGAADCSSSDPVRYSLWGLSPNTQTSSSQLSNQILNFLYPPNEAIDPTLTGMNPYFSPDNTKDFIDQYPHFHKHVPLVHPSTLQILEAHPGLTACMCCIGACYSKRVVLSDVRDMMEALWTAMERDYHILSEESLQDGHVAQVCESSVEELQAVLLTSILHLGNGTWQQKQRALHKWPMVAAQARRLGLLVLSGDASAYSVTRPRRWKPGSRETMPTEFDWVAWIGQEKRVRLMHALLAYDAISESVFGCPAQFDPSEAYIPLPCDDAAWNARSRDECRRALGLIQERSSTAPLFSGAMHRVAGPEFQAARHVLFDRGVELKPGSINVLGKIVLGITLIATIQQAFKTGNVNLTLSGGELMSLDWVVPMQGDNPWTCPPMPPQARLNLDSETASLLLSAVDKLQRSWHQDMAAGIPYDGKSDAVVRNGLTLPAMAHYLLSRAPCADSETNNKARAGGMCNAWHFVWGKISELGSNNNNNNCNNNNNIGDLSCEVQEANKHVGDEEWNFELAGIFGSVPHESDGAGTA
ncbi:hypothetical protein UVI_02019810 [Ustilaginoidea virens]|uniref:C2H2-type domain-containing protein n=1 Tax=Ustilaginoidea virens TaxID=1159556 RepID=A0A1B5L2C7_USTVR|nr:hypothetical protein UVI_02019810 [Ustilaginoidea virens]